MFKVKVFSSALISILFFTSVILRSDEAQSYASSPVVTNPSCEPDRSTVSLNSATGTLRVGLQAGHLDAYQLPDELAMLRTKTGTSGGGKHEWEVNQKIAELTAEILRTKGIIVDILPATIPPGYTADAFVAIHADYNSDTNISGFKSSGYRKDQTGKGHLLSSIIDAEYVKTSCMELDSHFTNNMRSYYAFSHDRFEHSIHPDTPGVIVETGFMSNKEDLDMLLNRPEIAATGIANGVIAYLNS